MASVQVLELGISLALADEKALQVLRLSTVSSQISCVKRHVAGVDGLPQTRHIPSFG